MNGFMASNTSPTPADGTPPIPHAHLGAAAAVLVVMAWCYWPTLVGLYGKWTSEPQHSHGILVPFFALYLLHMRGGLNAPLRRPLPLLGGMLLALGLAVRLVSGFLGIVWTDALSLLPCLAGWVLMFGGVEKFRWVWPSVAFLFFMVPLPLRLEALLSYQLQGLATQGSTFALQTLGQPAVAEGHTILLGEVRLGIVEACSGLRMLMTFFAFSTAVSLIVDRPIGERLLIVASAVPIALATNILRITCTGLMHVYVGGELAQKFFHDLAGWFMMPVCLIMLWAELRLLERLFLAVPPPAAAEPRTA
jgi:exosortase